MKLRHVALLGIAALGLAGCVVAPARPAYYGPPPVYAAQAPSIYFGPVARPYAYGLRPYGYRPYGWGRPGYGYGYGRSGYAHRY